MADVDNYDCFLPRVSYIYKNGDKIFGSLKYLVDRNNIKRSMMTYSIDYHTTALHDKWNKSYSKRIVDSDFVQKKQFLKNLNTYKYTKRILIPDLYKRTELIKELWNSSNAYSVPSLSICDSDGINVVFINSRSKSCHKFSNHPSSPPTNENSDIDDIADRPNMKYDISNSNLNTKFSLKVYRCQLFKTEDDSCCCSCNSDAMFEVMKSLYDCYKKKDCDNCNCILCGHLPREERKLGELRKSGVQIAVEDKKKLLKSKSLSYLGKSLAEKEKALKDIALAGRPLPKGKTKSDKDLIMKVRRDLGLPPETTNASDSEKYKKAYKAGIIIPLNGKTLPEKEEILTKLAENGIPLPEGRTTSEKALIEKIRANVPRKDLQEHYGQLDKAKSKSQKKKILKDFIKQGIPFPEAKTPSDQKLMNEVREEAGQKLTGLITPLDGKSKEQKKAILIELAKKGLPLPQAKSASDQEIMDKVRMDIGLPSEPKTAIEKDNYNRAMAAGIIIPLNGKTPSEKEKILREQAKMGLQLPEGRTPSEKALISKIKTTTPLKALPKEQKEKILKDLAKQGLPLPEAQSASEQKLMDKVRAELGLPPEPKDKSSKKIYDKALADGIIIPLNGKTPSEKEKILREQVKMGLQLPEGRTPSEKALIYKTKTTTPLKELPKEQKEKILKDFAKQGLPLPEAQSASEKKLMDQVRAELGLPPEPKDETSKKIYDKALKSGIIIPLNGKTPTEKEKILREQAKMGLQLPEGRTPSEKALISKIKATTPLKGLTKEQKENILKDLAKQGLPLPEAKSASEQKFMDKVRAQLGLPPEPKDETSKTIYNKALADGIIIPLNGKTPSEKEKILKEQAKMGLQLPEGRTPSEKALISKIKTTTPLKGLPKEQKEKILKDLAKQGLPLPEAQSASEQKLMDQVRAELGLPPEPKDETSKTKYDKALADGIIIPLNGKTPAEKEKILREQAKMGLQLPEGRTPSEKALISKIKTTTPLKGLPKEQKERILKDLVKEGLPLPEAKSASEKKLMDKVRAELGLPPEPKDESSKKVYEKALADGIIIPLNGKTPSQKEKILRQQAKMGLQLPEGRTPSEKALITKIKATTPLKGIPKEQKERMLKDLAKEGLQLPEAKSASEKELIDKVRAELGLPPEPKDKSSKKIYDKALAAGIIIPLNGKTPSEKEEILREQAKMGLQLPEGRTPSEKALISKIKTTTPLKGLTKEQKENILKDIAKQGIPLPEAQSASEQKLMDQVRAELGLPPEPRDETSKTKYDKALADGIIIPLNGKTPAEKEKILREQAKMGLQLPKGRTPSEKALISKIKATTPLKGLPKEQKERILKDLAKEGLPLPEAKSASEQELMDKVRAELGLPPEPKDKSSKKLYDKALAAGIIIPLKGKTPSQKEEILREQAKMGLQLPKGRTPSEKALISKIKATTPLKGLPKEQKERILKDLAKEGLPLPEAKSASEKELMDKVRAELGLPPEPKDKSSKKIYDKAMAAGRIIPLNGKTPSEKEEILREQAQMGLQLPKGRTPSEKALISKIKATTPLKGLPKEQKENILKDLAKQGIPLPEAQSASEKKLMDQVRAKLGLPPEPKDETSKTIYDKALADGIIIPLNGKTPSQKEKILREQAKMGLQLPEGRTPSEKALISKIKATTPLKGLPKEQKERILKDLANEGLPLPEAKSASEQELMDKVRAELGLPPEPKDKSSKKIYDKALADGIIIPLNGKTPSQKEKILREQAKMGLQLPEGRTPSEKALISKIKTTTPLKGLPKEQKEGILKDLAKEGLPLPEAKSTSEKELMDKIRTELGLPPEPKDKSSKKKYDKALAAGIIIPLNGKTSSEKEEILREQAKMGLQLPEGRTPSEKALISKIKATTPLKGLPKEQKESILKDLAKQGIQLPEAQSASEQKLMDQVRAELGLPPEPKDETSKAIYDKALADGIIIPLNGKTPSQKEKILREQAKMGLQLPEGRTTSEKALISKIKATTPLKGLPKEQKERMLKDLAKQGLPLPEAKSASEQKLMDHVRAELGLPPEPKDKSSKTIYDKALADGIIIPLNGKTPSQKEKILRKQAKMGLQLPEGRTPSEKALILKIKAETPLKGLPKEQKEKMLKGLVQKGVPLPRATTTSEQEIIDKVRAEVGLPPEPKDKSLKEKYDRAMSAGLITPLEGKSDSRKEEILRGQAKLGLPLPKGRTPSEKALISKIKETAPLKGLRKEQKEKILKGLVQKGVPLPRATTTSEQDVIDKVRAEVGLPPEPKDKQSKEKYDRAMAAGLITPLEGKSDSRKEEILRGQAKLGLPLPKGRTPSEKALIKKIKATTSVSDILSTKPTHVAGRPTLPPEQFKKMDLETRKSLKESKSPSDECICELFPQKVSQDVSPSEKLRKAKAAGLLTPLDGKSKEEKLKILKSLAKQGLPLPEANTDSDQELIDRFRADIGLPPEPTTSAEKKKYKKAMADGLITPLEGKSDSRKEEILRGQAKLGLQLPEGRTPSEKALISKIKAASPLKGLPKESKIKETSPLSGKTKAQREKILKGLLRDGLPLPRATTSSEQEVINKVRADVGLPPEPKDKLSEENYDRAMAAGLITPLEGKSDSRKEEILRGQAKLGLPLPKGRTPSEKALISKIKAEAPLKGLPKEQKEKILKGLVKKGVPLPMATTSSEQDLMDKVRADFGLPPEPKDKSFKEKYDRAMAAGLITPLEGKSDSRKEEILRGQAKLGLQLPEGRTPSEKALISKIKAETPLKGLPKEQKEKILKGLVKKGVPLPTATTSSEQDLIDKIRADVGLPPEPKDKSTKEKYDRAMAAGLITPLEGKSDSRKEEILRGRAQLGLQLPEGRTPSEKALIKKIKATTLLGPPALPPEKIEKLDKKSAKKMKEKGGPSTECICGLLKSESERLGISVMKPPSEKKITSHEALAKYIRKAKSGELLASLHGKNPEEKKKILKDLALKGIPLPKAKTASEQRMLDEIHFEVGLPPSPKTKRDKEIYKKAMAAGLITPLIGKSPAKKEEILRAQAKLGLPLPVGRTNSEKALVSKIKKTTQTEAKPSSSIKTISMKSGDTSMKKHVKGVGVSKSKGEIIEEFEDIVKTTKCDRGCGCDKKKIRFKHSYVKIRVTSPDISSLCPCPEECVPGVKGGVFTDNDGIKVVIGRVIGVPWLYSSELNQKRKLKTKRKLNDFTKTIDTKLSPHLNIYTSSLMGTDKNVVNDFITEDKITFIMPFNSYHNKPRLLNSKIKEELYTSQSSRVSSLETVYFIKSDSSITLTTSSGASSVSSFSITETSSYLDNYINKKSIDNIKIVIKLNSEENTSSNKYHSSDSDLSAQYICSTTSKWSSQILSRNSQKVFDYDYVVSRAIQSECHQFIDLRKHTYQERAMSMEKTTDLKIFKTIGKEFTENTLEEPSLIIIVSTSSDGSDANSSYLLDRSKSIIIGMQISENCSYWSNTTNSYHNSTCKSDGLKLVSEAKSSNDVVLIQLTNNTSTKSNLNIHENHNKTCVAFAGKVHRIVSTDTTEDRPCSCKPMENNNICEKLKEYQNPRRTKAYPEKPGQKVSFDVGCKEEERLSGLPPTPIVNKSPPKGPKEDASCPCSYILKSGNPTEEKWLNNGNTNTITKEDKTIMKNENIQCKCSMKPKPDFQVTPINESQMRILKSELTQCVSGFKLNVPRKTVEPEVSFEKILKYYVEKSEQIQYEDSKNDKNDKKRKPVSKKKNSMECECPKTEPVKGFKFHIGAKGPRSNGLAGILCFPLDISRSTF